MLRAVWMATLLGLAAPATLSVNSRVRVAPVFWSGQKSPAFLVECANDSDESRSLIEYSCRIASLRLDGVVHERGVAGSVLSRPGEPLEVAPGQTFRELVVLGDGPVAIPTFPKEMGEVLVGSQSLTELSGEHTIAFKCWSEWSSDVRFVWLK
jgi:hypothetical protein